MDDRIAFVEPPIDRQHANTANRRDHRFGINVEEGGAGGEGESLADIVAIKV